MRAATRAPLQVSSQSESYLKRETVNPQCGFSWSPSTHHTAACLGLTYKNGHHAVTLASTQHSLANIQVDDVIYNMGTFNPEAPLKYPEYQT